LKVTFRQTSICKIVNIQIDQPIYAAGFTRTHFMTHDKKLIVETYEGWNFNSGNYLFTTDTK